MVTHDARAQIQNDDGMVTHDTRAQIQKGNCQCKGKARPRPDLDHGDDPKISPLSRDPLKTRHHAVASDAARLACNHGS